jgi:hypothetical protein
MNKYHAAISALDWLNRNTDYRVNDVESSAGFKRVYGGMFGLSKFSTKDSFGIITGDDLVAFALNQGYTP